MNRSLFEQRKKQHDEEEEMIYQLLRPHSDRKHLPDRRMSFAGIPVSWDMKTSPFMEDKSFNEYWRCWKEGEPMFIVYKNEDKYYADWLNNLEITGPFPASNNSTSGDDYYRINGGRNIQEFRNSLQKETPIIKDHCMAQYTKPFWVNGDEP